MAAAGTEEIAAYISMLPRIRVWVPGCSTGEEAYSLAMLFLEEFAAAKTRREVADLCFRYRCKTRWTSPATAFTRTRSKLTYRRNGCSAFLRVRIKANRVSRELGDVIVFTDHDLLADPPFSRLNLISCRNLLIYLQPEEQRKVFSLFHFALSEGGYPFLGAMGPVTETMRIPADDRSEWAAA
jgi:two-component system, chemotaxis family, CheB/CheR fusion protein